MPVVWRCTVHSNRAPGVSVESSGQGQLELNQLYGNAEADMVPPPYVSPSVSPPFTFAVLPVSL